jgi:AraC-like DNA-binding protein
MSKNVYNQLQQNFLSELGSNLEFLHLFDLLDKIAFFAKDRRFKLIFANRFFYERLELNSDEDWIGKDDFELFPKPLAEKFRKDDETVIKTGKPMDQMVELFLNPQGIPDWYVTNKLPLKSKTGRVIGIMGTVQRYDQTVSAITKDKKIATLLERMRQSPEGTVSMAEIAKDMGWSHRQLDRRFKGATGLTPQQYLIRVRIENASHQLRETEKPLSEIAYASGFCDQSAFTLQFRKRMGLTPRNYRLEYGSNALQD